MTGPMRLKALEDLARMIFEDLDLELKEILLYDFDNPLHDTILGHI